ncbi:MAG: YfaZ family outer membrane protein [Granulosicoccus sp.]
MKKALAGLFLLFGSTTVLASGLDLALSNETANLTFTLNPDPLFYGSQAQEVAGGSEIALGAFITEDGANILHATLLARGYRQSVNSQYQISAGMKLIGGEIKVEESRAAAGREETVGALGLGFQAGLLLRQSPYNPVELSIEGFYAPSITSFTDAERYSEITTRLQVEVMPRARVYFGYRRLRFDTNDFDNVRLDRSAHFGMSISF